jgi:hypothetical protein
MRRVAWGAVGAGVLAPVVRRRLGVRPVLVQCAAFAAPVGLSVAVRRSRKRDVAVCALHMWAYIAAYAIPHDDAERQRERTHIRYPLAADRALGLGTLPTVRLQRALTRTGPDGPRWRAVDSALVWTHWLWFVVPHAALAWIMARRRERFPRAAAMMYAVFDIGACVYWAHPTAPPWYAASLSTAGLPRIAGAAPRLQAELSSPGSHARSRGPGQAAPSPRGGGWRAGCAEAVEHARGVDDLVEVLAVRRMMVEYGERFLGRWWAPMFGRLEGNPLAAMPSLHFATSAMAALLLAETEPVAGAFAGAYAATLGFALVYLGEHYAVDLLGGAVLTGAVYRLGPRAAPAFERARRFLAGLEALAHESR